MRTSVLFACFTIGVFASGFGTGQLMEGRHTEKARAIVEQQRRELTNAISQLSNDRTRFAEYEATLSHCTERLKAPLPEFPCDKTREGWVTSNQMAGQSHQKFICTGTEWVKWVEP